MDYSDSLIFAAPSVRERRVALGIALAALVAVILMAPFGHIAAGPSSPIVTLVYTAYVAAASLTAWLLRHQFRSSGYVPLALLGIAHAYGAVLIAPYLLTFPGVFAPHGLLGAGPQTAAWLWVLAHAGFVCIAFLYVCAEHFYGRTHDRPGSAEFIRASAAAALVGATTIIAVTIVHHDRLPILVLNDVTFTPLFTHRIVPILIFAYAIIFALVVTFTRLRTVTNLWVAVVLVSLTGELTAGGLISGSRYSWGWYLGCAEGAVAALTFLVVMLRQMNEVLVDFAISNRTLAEKSVRDHLTELLNRRGFDDRIAEVFRHMRRKSSAVALLMVDIDHFKAYNDQFGHIRGDDALRAIGNTIASAANRAQDSSCRIGGEEFAVVLPATDEEGALIVADRIRRNIAALKIAQSPGLETAMITVSIGVASTDREPDCDVRGLHARADIALYEAKRLGRNRVATYSAIEPARAARALLAS